MATIKDLLSAMIEKINENSTPTVEDTVYMLTEMDVVQPMADENGAVYTDTDGKAFVL